jgi:hypothetical protein
MHAIVFALLLVHPGAPDLHAAEPATPRDSFRDALRALSGPDREARAQRERCLASGAVGAVGGLVGLGVGAALALGAAEIVKAADPANTSASKSFAGVAVPAMAAAGGLAGLAVGTLGGWELSEDVAGKLPVTR